MQRCIGSARAMSPRLMSDTSSVSMSLLLTGFDGLQRAVEVFDQIAGVFQSAGEADEAGTEAGGGHLLLGQQRAPHGGRADREALDAAQAGRQLKQRETLDESRGGCETAGNLDAQHPSESR